MKKKKETVKRCFGLLMAVILAVGMVFPMTANADDSYLPEEAEIDISDANAAAEEEVVPGDSDHVENKYSLNSENVAEEESFEDDGAVNEGENTMGNAADVPAICSDELSISLGQSLDVELPYSTDESDAVIIRFDCTEEGFYTVLKDAGDYFGVDWGTGNGIYFSVYRADQDGNINYADKIYDNNYRSGFQNPWYSDDAHAIRMCKGETYYLWVLNRSWDKQDTTKTFFLRHRELQLTVANESAEGIKTGEVCLNFEGSTYYSTPILGYVEGDYEALAAGTEKNYTSAVKLSLAPGESKTLSIIPNTQALSWKLAIKYSSDCDTIVSGDYIGSWTYDERQHAYSMSYTGMQANDPGPDTTFRSVYDLSDLKAGDHYILAAKSGDSYYALACDFINFETPIALTEAELENADGIAYSGYTLDVSERDIKNSDYVLECMQPGNNSDTYTPDAKFRSNIVDAETGKRLALKMGRWGGDNRKYMFADTSGDIYISKNHDGEGYSVLHSSYGRLKLEDLYSGETAFTWNRSYGEANYDIIILTDSKGSKKTEPEGEQLFTRISVFDLYNAPSDSRILMVCEDENGTHYAFTTKGPAAIGDPTSEDYPPANYNEPVPGIYVDVSCASVPQGLITGFYGNDLYYTVNGFIQNGKYLDIFGMYHSDSDEPYTSSGSSAFDFLAVKDAYSQNYDVSYAYKTVIRTVNAYLGWDPDKKDFCEVTNIEDAARFELYSMVEGYAEEKYHEVDDLTGIEDWEKIIITVEGADGKEMMLVYNGNDLDATEVLDAAPANEYYPCYYSSDDTITTVSRYAMTPGDVISMSKSNFKIRSLTWKDSSKSLYIDGYVKNGIDGAGGLMTDSKEKECMFSYASDGNSIVLRGAKNWLKYDPETGELSAVADKEDATPIRIWAIDRSSKKDLIDVIYYADDTNILRELKTEKDIELMELPEIVHDGEEYIFVGWSTDKDSCGFLSLDDSCNLYDYYEDTDTGYIKKSIAEKYSLLGNCSPDILDTIDPYLYATNSKLELYPVYARKSFDSVVTADDGDTPIIGITDWKDLQGQRPQGGHDEDEVWLGKIYCSVYLDGELWVDSEPLYFCYHNDDAADINLKFISNELLENYKDYDDPMLAFMSDENAYPAASQKGNYVIDAVYASQGGSEDGLKYKYNWISGCGGRLDNVEGGSTINVYVTSLYQVEYFMDDVELTGDAWQNANVYATPGTDSAVNEKIASAEHVVKTDNDLCKLMDHSVSDDSTFVDDNMVRGDYSSFVYCITDYQHTIPAAQFPEAPEGREIISEAWELKIPDAGEGDIETAALNAEDENDADADEIAADPAQTLVTVEKIAPGSDYDVTGTKYGTGNTVNSWKDDVDDSVYTYHLYIYTKEKEPTPTPTPTVTPTPDAGGNGATAVNTGDSSAPVVYYIVIAAAALIAAVVIIRRRRK